MRIIHINKNFTFKTAKTSLKRAWRKLKYLDKTQFNYFVVTGFIGFFCLTTAFSYAAFVVSNTINNAITLRIAKLNYTLQASGTPSNATVNCSDTSCTITVAANTTGMATFTLTSQNPIITKYALSYSSKGDKTNVYYSQNLTYNMVGTIGTTGSDVVLRVVVENTNASASENAVISVTGGYLQNGLTSNITNGYYEQDVTLRTILMDENFSISDTTQTTFPSRTAGYAYYKTECTEESNPVWDFDTWSLDLNKVTKQISCDVYFKKLTTGKDLEIAYKIIDANGNVTMSNEVITDSNYGYQGTTCSSNASGSWSRVDGKITISNVDGQTLCVATFEYGKEDVPDIPDVSNVTYSSTYTSCTNLDCALNELYDLF